MVRGGWMKVLMVYKAIWWCCDSNFMGTEQHFISNCSTDHIVLTSGSAAGVPIENSHDHMRECVCRVCMCVCVKGGDRSVCAVVWAHETYSMCMSISVCSYVPYYVCVLVCHRICYKVSFGAHKHLFYQESSHLWLSCASPPGHWRPDSHTGQQLVLKCSNFIKPCIGEKTLKRYKNNTLMNL